MKDQNQHSDGELQEAFDAARKLARENLKEGATDEILQQLSRTISRLQENGADISIETRYGASNNAYDMTYTASSTSNHAVSSGTMRAHGFIRVGQVTHLFAIASKVDGKDTEQLFISKYAVSNEGGRTKPQQGAAGTRTQSIIFADMFDFAKDADALKKLEKTLMARIAENEALQAQDVSGVFNKPAPLKGNIKPGLKLKS